MKRPSALCVPFDTVYALQADSSETDAEDTTPHATSPTNQEAMSLYRSRRYAVRKRLNLIRLSAPKLACRTMGCKRVLERHRRPVRTSV